MQILIHTTKDFNSSHGYLPDQYAAKKFQLYTQRRQLRTLVMSQRDKEKKKMLHKMSSA